MKNLKIKIVAGFRKDQHYTIGAEEAHKAYYLFLNPDKRGVFNTGLAIIGSDIRAIEPDYNATMGWNPTHDLGDDDWNDLKKENVLKELRELLSTAKGLAVNRPDLINLPLDEAKAKLLK